MGITLSKHEAKQRGMLLAKVVEADRHVGNENNVNSLQVCTT